MHNGSSQKSNYVTKLPQFQFQLHRSSAELCHPLHFPWWQWRLPRQTSSRQGSRKTPRKTWWRLTWPRSVLVKSQVFSSWFNNCLVTASSTNQPMRVQYGCHVTCHQPIRRLTMLVTASIFPWLIILFKLHLQPLHTVTKINNNMKMNEEYFFDASDKALFLEKIKIFSKENHTFNITSSLL